KQVEQVRTVHSCGNDLLALIDEILDLAKIESGTMEVQVAHLPFTDLRDYVERNFRPVAEAKGLAFSVLLHEQLPDAIYTDPQRLQRVLRNLLSKVFKFRERGSFTLRMQVATSGWSPDYERLNRADQVIAFSVADPGIGTPADRQQLIFEAFRQADG